MNLKSISRKYDSLCGANWNQFIKQHTKIRRTSFNSTRLRHDENINASSYSQESFLKFHFFFSLASLNPCILSLVKTKSLMTPDFMSLTLSRSLSFIRNRFISAIIKQFLTARSMKQLLCKFRVTYNVAQRRKVLVIAQLGALGTHELSLHYTNWMRRYYYHPQSFWHCFSFFFLLVYVPES